MAGDGRKGDGWPLTDRPIGSSERGGSNRMDDAVNRTLNTAHSGAKRPSTSDILVGAERVRRNLLLPIPDHGELLFDEHGLPK